MKFIISGFQTSYQEIDEAFSDPEGLNWQVSRSLLEGIFPQLLLQVQVNPLMYFLV